MKTDNPNVIAKENLLWLKPDGTQVSVSAQVGTPYLLDDDCWACPVMIQGVDGRYPDIHGGTSMQALSLALRLISKRLEYLIESGEKLVFADDQTSAYNIQSLYATFACFEHNEESGPEP